MSIGGSFVNSVFSEIWGFWEKILFNVEKLRWFSLKNIILRVEIARIHYVKHPRTQTKWQYTLKKSNFLTSKTHISRKGQNLQMKRTVMILVNLNLDFEPGSSIPITELITD